MFTISFDGIKYKKYPRFKTLRHFKEIDLSVAKSSYLADFIIDIYLFPWIYFCKTLILLIKDW